jgi:hypothetical protein
VGIQPQPRAGIEIEAGSMEEAFNSTIVHPGNGELATAIGRTA